MGISRLTNIVNNIPSVWTPERLCDTEVIIDGNSLMYFLYEPKDCRAGGEYGKFSSAIADFFAKLEEQRVTPYVVLDGANVAVAKKSEIVIKRTKDKIARCHRISKGELCKKTEMVLPPLAKEAFVQKLRSLRIEFRVCNGCEADQEIARLAYQKKYPVISRDNDFFIYDLPKGYIPLDNLENGKEYPKRFYREKLSQYLGIPPSFMPLLASLIKEDFVQEKALASFYQELGIEQSNWLDENKIKTISSHFREKSSEEEALQSVLNFLPTENDKVRLREALSKSMDEYNLSGSNETSASQSAHRGTDSSVNVPGYVIESHRAGYFPSNYMGVILSTQHILTLQIEDTKEKSVSNCSEKLRKVMYGIILNPGQQVTEWNRMDRGLRLQERSVEPDKDYVESYNLEDLKTQDEEQRRRLLLLIFDSKEVELPKDKELFVMSIRYWIAHAEPRVIERHVQTLILQHLQPRTSVEPTLSFDLELQHSLAQWQSVMSETMSLNQILWRPFPEPDVSTLYSGATSQGIMYEMLQGKALDQFISQMENQNEYEKLYKAATAGLGQKLLDPSLDEGYIPINSKSKSKDNELHKFQKKAFISTSNRYGPLQKSPDDSDDD